MVTLKGSYTVKPASVSPTGLMYLSEFDQFLALSHATTVYFYRSTGDDQLTANATEILKDSLSKALDVFYPLAGRLQWTDRGRLKLNCNSMGALFLEAESEAKIDDFGDFSPTPETRSLVPPADYNKPIHELPLLLVQLTRFTCGGICLGLGVSHVLADGRCAAHFVAEWARIARGEQPEKLPFLDRTVLKPAEEDLPVLCFDHVELSPQPILIGGLDNSEERKKETVVAMMKLNKEQIQKLKNEANKYRFIDDGKPFTRYEAVAAHIWRCATRARGHESEQLMSARITLDFSSRMVPPLPQCYFGNAVLPLKSTATSGELLSKPLGYASSKIKESIVKVTDGYVRSALTYLKREEDLSKFRFFQVVGSTRGAFLGNPNMSITDWVTLPLYGVDFGWISGGGRKFTWDLQLLRTTGRRLSFPVAMRTVLS